MAVTIQSLMLLNFNEVLKKCSKHFVVSIIMSTFAPQLRTEAFKGALVQ